MPRVQNTRKQRAEVLRNRLLKGPSFSQFTMTPEAIAEAGRQFRLWSESWIIGELDDLVPELRKKAVR
jgi:hypothetical protein